VSLIVDEHRQYLADHVRLAAFEAAIASVVQPGQVVLDLASGTGIMGLLACRAGASRVYSVEVGGMVSVAREVARVNGFGSQVLFIKGHSMYVELPERVDVVVADQIGNFGFNAGIIKYFADARRRFLKPNGVTVPRQMSLILAPVEAPDLFANVTFWNSAPAGFDFRSARILAANTGYQVNLSPECMCGDPVVIAGVDLNHATGGPFHGDTTALIQRSGVMHGLGGWFTAELADRVLMTNSPIANQRIQRRQVFFPIEHPVDVGAGDRVNIRMTVRPADSVVNWTVVVVDGSSGRTKGAFRHSTWKGMLLATEDLERTRPEFRPTLIPRGEGRKTVVNLCDGARTLREIEDEVFRLHPNLFHTREDAAAFVAEVITAYAE
jgi:protein arginine N-methyltransferase 1